MSSSASTGGVSFLRTTKAVGWNPSMGCGVATIAASNTEGCVSMIASNCSGETLKKLCLLMYYYNVLGEALIKLR